jgi:CheY-like chemotaxis protein
MVSFNIREVCSALISSLQRAIGTNNVIKLSLDVQIPERVTGQWDMGADCLGKICKFLSTKLVNGIIGIEIIKERHHENEITLSFEIQGTDSRFREGAQFGITPKNYIADAVELALDLPLVIETFSDENKTTFIFKLTLLAMDQMGQSNELLFAGKHVLLVEDNEINAIVFSDFLEGWSCKITRATNGAEAVSLTQDEDFDIILMDIHMPVMNGIRATKAIRETNSSIPIIALTASNLEIDLAEARIAGVQDYLVKPVSSNQLYKTMKKFFN